MAVVIETTAGDLTVDLFVQERPKACLNFLKLCKLKYYNYNLFHTIEHGFIAQTGDLSGAGTGGESIWGVIEGTGKRFFKAEYQPKIRHTEPGLLSMVSLGDNLIGSQFFFTLGHDLTSLDAVHCVIGQVTEGHDVLRSLNDAICDNAHRPYKDIRITHTVILEDPFDNPRGFREPSRSPSPSAERLKGGRIGADEDIDDTEGKTEQEVHEMLQDREAKARATILEIVGDLPDAEVAPPENVLFVCKLNPVTSDEDLEIIFSRFGKVKGCEVIRDRTSGDSLQYAFVEFEDAKTCESAYFKMDNVLIDDRRIHVDFSQSVAKVQWKGKGRGLIFKNGNTSNKLNFADLKGKGDNDGHRNDSQKYSNNSTRNAQPFNRQGRKRSHSPLKMPERSDATGYRNDRNINRSGGNNSSNNRYRNDRNSGQFDRNENNDRYSSRSQINSEKRGNENRSRDGVRYRRSRSPTPKRGSASQNQRKLKSRSRSPRRHRRSRSTTPTRGPALQTQRKLKSRSRSPRRDTNRIDLSSSRNSDVRLKDNRTKHESSRLNTNRDNSGDNERATSRKKIKKSKKKKSKKSKKSKRVSSSSSDSNSS